MRLERAEVPVWQVTANGAPSRVGGRWVVPAYLHLSDGRILSWKLGPFWRRRANRTADRLAYGAVRPLRPCYALIQRGRVVGLRFEVAGDNIETAGVS